MLRAFQLSGDNLGGRVYAGYLEARARDSKSAVESFRELGLPPEVSELVGKGRWIEEKALVAVLIRKRTGVRNRWVSERLAMGHEGNVTRAIRKVNGNPARRSKLADLEAMLVRRD